MNNLSEPLHDESQLSILPSSDHLADQVAPGNDLCVVTYFIKAYEERICRRKHALYVDGQLAASVSCGTQEGIKSIPLPRGKHLFFVEFDEKYHSKHISGPMGGAESAGWRTSGTTPEIAIDCGGEDLKLTLKPRWRRKTFLIFSSAVPDEPAYELTIF